MLQTCDKFSLFGPACYGWISCRLEGQCCLLARIVLTNVTQALQAPDIPWQIACAHATKHPPVGHEQRKEARRSLLMPLPAHVCLLGMMDVRMEGALHRPIAARGVRGEPTADVDGEVRGRLHRLHRDIAGRLEDASPLATDSGDNRGPVLCRSDPDPVHAACGAHVPGVSGAFFRRVALGPCGRRCDRGHPPRPCRPPDAASRRTRPHGAATRPSDNWSG
jgi:hypothetical protein